LRTLSPIFHFKLCTFCWQGAQEYFLAQGTLATPLDALFQSPLPRFHALLEGFLRNRSELSRHGCFNGFLVLKTSSFDDFLEYGKQKEVTRGQIWRVGWLLQYSNVIFGKKLPNSHGIMSWSIVMMKQS